MKYKLLKWLKLLKLLYMISITDNIQTDPKNIIDRVMEVLMMYCQYGITILMARKWILI